MRFLLVEDNPGLASAISDRLGMDGHVVDHAEDLQRAEEFASSGEYDLILLDIMLPDGDGRDFLNTHRRQHDDTPVIVLTARSEISDRVGVLDLGADDYITKPFDFAELEARVRGRFAAPIRRGAEPKAKSVIWYLTGCQERWRWAMNRSACATRNCVCLRFSLRRPGKIFSKSNLWTGSFPITRTCPENAIEVYVARLRKHLKGSAVEIATVRGLGYRITEQ